MSSKFDVGKLLPNINVAVDPSICIVTSSTVTTDEEMLDCDLDKEEPEIIKPSIEPLVINPKTYKSSDGGFATGIDLFSEKNSEMLSIRAERFGLSMDESKPTLKALYESLGITDEKLKSGRMKHLRLDTMHMRGIENLDTNDVLKYFQKFGPLNVEWINDFSCNVTFCDEASCGRALLGLSTPYPASLYNKMKSSDSELPEKSSQENEMDVEPFEEDVKIPVPPGDWRLGTKHPLAKAILLRFATTSDKKLPGAEKRSVFYKNRGNPNYEGLKGIISTSRKLKHRAAVNKLAVSKSKFVADVESLKLELKKTMEKRTAIIKEKKSSSKPKIVPFMYADEEELRLKNKRSALERKSGVHSRLGKKFTSDELARSDNASLRSDNASESVPYNYRRKSNSDLRNKIKKLREGNTTKSKSYHRYHDRESTYRESSYSRRSYNRHDDREASYWGESKSSSYHRHDDRDLINYDFEESQDHSNLPPKRISDPKSEKRSYFKRKHRSILIDDDDDDNTDTS